MTPTLWLRDIAAFGVQAGLLVVAGACLARAFRLRAPKATLAYWRTLLLACLLLPFCQPWTRVTPVPEVTAAPIGDAAAIAVQRAVPFQDGDRGIRPELEAAILIAIGGGIAARTAWLLIGACALVRLRRRAEPLHPLPVSIRRAQERVGTSASICVSDRIAGPITFGLIRPVILFPPGVSSMAPHVQEAIACHELIHVRRRDWVAGVLEEGVRTILWFHPAIWWLIDRVQLSREQAVDAEAIRLIESRDRYVEALLAVAVAKSTRVLVPAAPFLRKRLLKKRVALILQESTMTTRRLILSFATSAGVLAVAAAMAIQSFPLKAQGQPRVAGAPVQIVKGGDHLMHGDLPEYPRRAIEQKVEGEIVVDLAVDDRGEVADARVLSGPDELRKATLEAVLQWHYSPADVASRSTQAVLRFQLPTDSVEVEFKGEKRAFAIHNRIDPDELRARAQRLEHQIDEIKGAVQSPDTSAAQREELKARLDTMQSQLLKARAIESNAGNPPIDGQARLSRVRSERVTDAAVQAIMTQAGVALGDRLTEDTIKRMQKIATGLDEHLRVEVAPDGQGGAIVTIISR